MKRTVFLLILLGSLFCSIRTPAQDFKSHIDFLASEACAGRVTQTKGDTLAVNYIVDQLKAIDGVTLLGKNGTQDFAFNGARATLADSTQLSVNKSKMHYGKEYVVLPVSNSGTYTGETVYLGALDAEKIKDMDLKGKMVLLDQKVTDGRPFMRILYQATALEEVGATGIIFISDTVNARYSTSRAMAGSRAVYLNVNKALGERLKKGATVKVCTIVRTTTEGQRIGRNIVAKIAANPALNPNGECIVIGGHYDHMGIRNTEQGNQMYPGADDNASGIATVIELARYVSTLRPVLKKDVYFVAFGCEESGLIGSFYYAEHPLEPLDNARAMLNFDMVGRMSDYQLDIEAFNSWDLWPNFLSQLPNKDRLNLIWLNRSPGGTDYAGFTARGIPALSFCTGLHPDYHKPTDTPDKINYQGLKAVYDYVTNIVDRLVLLNY